MLIAGNSCVTPSLAGDVRRKADSFHGSTTGFAGSYCQNIHPRSASSVDVSRHFDTGGRALIIRSRRISKAIHRSEVGEMFERRPKLIALRGLMLAGCVVILAGCGAAANTSAANKSPASVPAPPSDLSATAGDAAVTLKWTASSGATGYNVKRATTSGGPYTQIAAPTSTSYSDTSLTNGTTYYYVVSAVNSMGESPNSAQVTANPIAAATVTVTVTPSSTHLISPYIYGVNNAY